MIIIWYCMHIFSHGQYHLSVHTVNLSYSLVC